MFREGQVESTPFCVCWCGWKSQRLISKFCTLWFPFLTVLWERILSAACQARSVGGLGLKVRAMSNRIVSPLIMEHLLVRQSVVSSLCPTRWESFKLGHWKPFSWPAAYKPKLLHSPLVLLTTCNIPFFSWERKLNIKNTSQDGALALRDAQLLQKEPECKSPFLHWPHTCWESLITAWWIWCRG